VSAQQAGTPAGSWTVTSAHTSKKVTGLTDGDAYTFTVVATSSAGDSAPSAPSTAVTPTAPPATFTLHPETAYDATGKQVVLHVLRSATGSIDDSTLRVVSQPWHGSAHANPDGTITYSANGWTGTMSFQFSVCATSGTCGTQTATVYVLGNDQRWVDASGLDMRDSNLSGLNFSHSEFAGTDLAGADLQGASLQGSDLSNVDFTGADLQGANLGYTNVTGTIVNGANLTGANIDGVYGGSSPQVQSISLSTPASTAVTSDVLATVTDPDVPVDPSSLRLVGGQGPSNGTVAVHPDGTVTYTPQGAYTGPDHFTLVVANVFGFSADIPVDVTVGP
jgi:hypothetical protein